MSVRFLPEVIHYFIELADVLLEKQYFSFEEAAIAYADELFNDIISTLPIKYKKPAPAYFNRYGKGMYYTVFKKNDSTSWYVFFSTFRQAEETVYLVRYISNNHVVAQHLL